MISDVVGPLLSNDDGVNGTGRRKEWLPTVIADAAPPGLPMLNGIHEFPAATAHKTLYLFATSLTSFETGSSPPLSKRDPSDMLKTSHLKSKTAFSMHSMTHDICPVPLSLSAFSAYKFASGAAPIRSPCSVLTGRPAAALQHHVPCEFSSSTLSPGTALNVAFRFDVSISCCCETPVSITPILTPLPVIPCSHSSGAPVAPTLSPRGIISCFSTSTPNGNAMAAYRGSS